MGDLQERSYKRYLETNKGRSLLKENKLTDYGLWQIYGEDSNPDYNGSHVEPFIGCYEGILKDAIEVATAHPKFWTWGGGGSIKPVGAFLKKSEEKEPVASNQLTRIATRIETNQLIELIEQKTKNGKLKWRKSRGEGLGAYEASLEGVTLTVEYFSCQKDGEWYQLQLSGDGTAIQLDAGAAKRIYDYIENKPGNDLKSKAFDVLSKL